ncbi:hypothetical protein [Nocardioides sp.]|uniref:hypothetical protein n=1 Tax=Nocardioides sp. TaxID=35761 RepID=UPI00356B1685
MRPAQGRRGRAVGGLLLAAGSSVAAVGASGRDLAEAPHRDAVIAFVVIAIAHAVAVPLWRGLPPWPRAPLGLLALAEATGAGALAGARAGIEAGIEVGIVAATVVLSGVAVGSATGLALAAAARVPAVEAAASPVADDGPSCWVCENRGPAARAACCGTRDSR